MEGLQAVTTLLNDRARLKMRVSDAKREQLPHEGRLEKRARVITKPYKPRVVGIQRDHGRYYLLRVPPLYGTDLVGAHFRCELTDEGLLYRRVQSERAA